MNLLFRKKPFPHLVINDYFDEQELVDVWRELLFLSVNSKLLSPEETGSTTALKNNRGVFLDTLYANRKFSDILTHTRKLFAPTLISEGEKFDWMFKYLKSSNNDTTMVSYYEEGGYYKPHKDFAVLTALIHLFKTPRRFEGGELFFPEFNYNYGLENNRLILFPSAVAHEVKEVKMKANAAEEQFSGRYTITQFMRVI